MTQSSVETTDLKTGTKAGSKTTGNKATRDKEYFYCHGWRPHSVFTFMLSACGDVQQCPPPPLHLWEMARIFSRITPSGSRRFLMGSLEILIETLEARISVHTRFLKQ